ncbi:MAG: hypothetical protein J6S71_06900 [Clostridia bacterium]|nr:hypothetical protein [Clostridia bacterium]
MIIKEFYRTRSDGVELYRSYSDKGVYIHKVGTDELYTEAVDVAGAPYEYEETDMPVDTSVDTDEATAHDYQNALEELGVTFDEENNIE